MPRYRRGESQQESGPNLEGEIQKGNLTRKNLEKRRTELHQVI